MEFWDSVFNVINFLFALLSLATIILGAYILIKGPINYQPPPLVEPIAARLMGGVAIVGGLEMLFRTAYFLFTGKLFGMDYLATASAFLLFLTVMGIAIIVERPFLAANLMPKIASRRWLLGLSFIVFGFLCFFKLSEDYWPVPETIQDLIFWAIFFLLISSPVLMSRLRKQAN